MKRQKRDGGNAFAKKPSIQCAALLLCRRSRTQTGVSRAPSAGQSRRSIPAIGALIAGHPEAHNQGRLWIRGIALGSAALAALGGLGDRAPWAWGVAACIVAYELGRLDWHRDQGSARDDLERLDKDFVAFKKTAAKERHELDAQLDAANKEIAMQQREKASLAGELGRMEAERELAGRALVRGAAE